ncbi:hypothetical protein FLONG3_5423 [Fusarium longipes]|uniref:Uncharacterized protein n=1 Tax=Fusarium longipes TaxID=694270 RepID=A0A395SVD6_9HYPO|nr:hypothetical protein FLONG3_5423 [Fusarium longipes]
MRQEGPSLTVINPPKPLLQTLEVKFPSMVRLEARPKLFDSSITRVLWLPKPLLDSHNYSGHAHDDGYGCAGGISRSGRTSGSVGATGAKSPALQGNVVFMDSWGRAYRAAAKSKKMLSGYRKDMAEQGTGGQEEKAGVEMPIGERAVTLVAGRAPNRVNVLLLLFKKYTRIAVVELSPGFQKPPWMLSGTAGPALTINQRHCIMLSAPEGPAELFSCRL